MLNPVNELVDRYGQVNTIAVLVVAVVVVSMATADGSLLTAVVVAAAIVGVATADGFTTTNEQDELADAKRLYVSGEIDLREFQRRADAILDDRAAEIRTVVETVGGVGPATSASIADHFDSVDDLRIATVGELQDVHGVGESTAAAIVDQIGVDLQELAADRREQIDAAGATQ